MATKKFLGIVLSVFAFVFLLCWQESLAQDRKPQSLTKKERGRLQARFGPHRTTPEMGIPKHAYSPFDDKRVGGSPFPEDTSDEDCDSCQDTSPAYPLHNLRTEETSRTDNAVSGVILLKLKEDVEPSPDGKAAVMVGPESSQPLDENGVRSKTGAKRSTSRVASLNTLLTKYGATGLKPVFPTLKGPRRAKFMAKAKRLAAAYEDQERLPDLSRWHFLSVPETVNRDELLDELNEDPSVLAGEPDYERRMNQVGLPNPGTDPRYGDQWCLDAVSAPDAWRYLADQGLPPGGSRDIVVAVIDSGVDYTHPDLAANMWVNTGEIPGNGVDDDSNGFVDDIYGANVVSDARSESGDPIDVHGHGTHVAGIVAAQAHNGTGIVGVAYNVQIMAIRAAQYSGVLSSSDIAQAILYAVEKGADVINMSFGGYSRSTLEEDALAIGFGQAVLVAAAGNDSKVNLPCLGGIDMYPAAYNWVLGVMASTSGGSRASFSNYDCIPHDTHEYELMAPGVDVLSTLPSEAYGSWDGTSMAAPIVSGIAALLRTKWSDKDVYSSRFIMGQIASNAVPVANAFTALTVAPEPELSYLEHWLFDTEDQSPDNDSDGIVDAGETVELAIVIRNHWGKAESVNVTLRAWNGVSEWDDPYVTMDIGTVDYGAVGSFNIDDNGLIYDDEGAITGVRHPFRFTVSLDAPNDHVIPFLLSMTCQNGLDPDDTTTYTFKSRFYLIVQRGRELPRIISEDMTLTKDHYWIVPDQTRIEEGVTVTVTEGTQVQFWSGDPNDPYHLPPNAYIDVQGKMLAIGTVDEPIQLFTGFGYDDEFVKITSAILQSGVVDLRYVIVDKPRFGINEMDHCYTTCTWTADIAVRGYYPVVTASGNISNCIFHRMVRFRVSANALESNLFDRGQVGFRDFNYYSGAVVEPCYMPSTTKGNVFLNNYRIRRSGGVGVSALSLPFLPENQTSITDNAFLNPWINPNINYWLWIFGGGASFGGVTYLQNNYWGTVSSDLISSAIYDYCDDFSRDMIVYRPVLTDAPETAYPFAVDVTLSIPGDADASIVGAEEVTFSVIFNRDMDRNVQPQVSFGPDVPMTDYTIHPVEGGWQDSRTWVGTFHVNPITGDGYQLIRVAGAVAADDPWLVTGDDAGRFRFEIQTSGTEAMNLQATGAEGYVDLSWFQDDFDLLAGYHLYRADTEEGTYSRLNQTIIPSDVKSYKDRAGLPGQMYYYKFTVVKTDMTESDFSNVASAAPVDTIPPVITHTPITSAAVGLQLQFFADVTDNVRVEAVTLYYRVQREVDFQARSMVNTTGNRYSTTLEGSRVVSPGLEYYIEAGDGVGFTRAGSLSAPYFVQVSDNPEITTISPSRGLASGGTLVTISGSNFKEGATVTFGGESATIQEITENRILCLSPPHIPATVDIVVANASGDEGVLLRAYTYETEAVLSLATLEVDPSSVVEIPLDLEWTFTGENAGGLLAANVIIHYDPTVLSSPVVQTTSFTTDFTLDVNAGTPGELNLSMAASTPADGDGALVIITFSVVGDQGTSSPLDIVFASLNERAIQATLLDGQVTVRTGFSIAGNVGYYTNSQAVEDIQILMSGTGSRSTLTNADGHYQFGGLVVGDYTLVPSKDGGENEGITAMDAALALQAEDGRIVLTEDQTTAGDVSADGNVTSMDASYILQYVVSLLDLPFPGSGEVWKFRPPSRSYENLSANWTNQDFTAILVGDINGNWTAPAGASTGSKSGGSVPEIVIGSSAVRSGSAFSLPISCLQNAGFVALQLVIDYDPTVVSIQAVEKTSLTSQFLFAANVETPGIIRVAMASANPVTTDGEILSIQGVATGAVGTSCQFEVISTRFDDDPNILETTAGTLTVIAPDIPTPTETPSPTHRPTDTPTTTKTPTPTYTPTDTPADRRTPTQAPTHTPTVTPTHAPTDTPTGTITPTEIPSFLWGDLNVDGVPGAVDAGLLLRYDVFLIDRFPGYAHIVFPDYPPAADLNADGVPGAVDAGLLLRYDVFLILSFPVDLNQDGYGPDAAAGKMPSQKSSMSQQDDVGENSSPPGRRFFASVESVGQQESSNPSWVLNFSVDNAADIQGLRLAVHYDSDVMRVSEDSVEWLISDRDKEFAVNVEKDGLVIVSGALSEPLGSETSDLMSVRFEGRSASDGQGDPITVRLDKQLTRINDGNIYVHPESVSEITLVVDTSVSDWMIYR